MAKFTAAPIARAKGLSVTFGVGYLPGDIGLVTIRVALSCGDLDKITPELLNDNVDLAHHQSMISES
jgi:hypothetical protein